MKIPSVRYSFEKPFEKIMQDKDVAYGLEYIKHRASTIRVIQIIEMIQRELNTNDKNNEECEENAT